MGSPPTATTLRKILWFYLELSKLQDNVKIYNFSSLSVFWHKKKKQKNLQTVFSDDSSSQEHSSWLPLGIEKTWWSSVCSSSGELQEWFQWEAARTFPTFDGASATWLWDGPTAGQDQSITKAGNISGITY